MKNNFAFFDFCETIVAVQSADDFVKYVLIKKNRFDKVILWYFLKSKPMNFFLKFIGLKKNRKAILLSLLSGLRKNSIDGYASLYYNEKLKSKLNANVLDKIKTLQSTHYIFIVSGGYFPYINCFAQEFSIDNVIANEFLYKKDLFTGKIKSRDCLGNEKVKRVKYFLKIKNNKLENSIAFSDCLSDKPLFDFCESAYLIFYKNGKPQIKSYE